MNPLNPLRIAALAVGLSANLGFAQAPCPTGFVHVGQAYQEASALNAEAKVPAVPVTVIFPKNFSMDASYRQIGGRWGGGSASAVMTDGDVPNGLHIIASGTEGGSKGWSMGKPSMRALEEDDGRIVQRGYEVKLYCHTGSGAADMLGHVSCNVKAVFCAKQKPA
jgi:hypothetical protein